eukprot:s2000_g6.t1
MTPVVNAVSSGVPEEDEGTEDLPAVLKFKNAPIKLHCVSLQEESSGRHSRDLLREMSSKDANFHPMTFVNEHLDDEDMKIVSGHDKMDPGKLPAKATLLMVLLWAIGLAVPFGVFREFFTKPLMIDFTFSGSDKGGGEEIQAVVGTRPDGLPELIPMVSHRKDLHSLLQGHPIHVQWPLKSGLKPRTLSCDPAGKVLVVADDLGVYAGQVTREADVAKVRFDRVPPCGRLLAECPLQRSFVKQQADTGHMTVAALPDTEPKQWKIPDTWLHHGARSKRPEQIKALAANSDCMMGGFQANDEGCVAAGTSEGRVVELRESHIKNHTLVPERAMEQRNEALSAGSLHFSSKGYVMVLRRKSRSVQAFDTLRGTNAGEWRLPQHINWLALGGGGKKLFALGVEKGETELYEFPLPEKLRVDVDNDNRQSPTNCASPLMPSRMTQRTIPVLRVIPAILCIQLPPEKHARCLWRLAPSCAVHRPMGGSLLLTSPPMVMAGVQSSWTAPWTSRIFKLEVLGQHAKRFYPLCHKYPQIKLNKPKKKYNKNIHFFLINNKFINLIFNKLIYLFFKN